MKLRVNFDGLAIFLIMFAEISFYTVESIALYNILTLLGLGLSFMVSLQNFSSKFRLDAFILWLIIAYFMYFVYGFFFLRAGVFSFSSIFYRFIEGIFIYLSCLRLSKIDFSSIIKPIFLAGLSSVIYLVYIGKTDILSGGMRVGEALSGNVNTVGFNFGLISLLTMWWYLTDKKYYKLVCAAIFAVIVLLTGSKKALFFIVLDVLLYGWFNRHRLRTILKISLIILLVGFVIFKVPYFYNIIGIRLVQMYSTIFGVNADLYYSHSTQAREQMIVEGFAFFLEHPILGGGWNYFASRTSTGYEYSHNNIIELLSNFGLIGTLVYYQMHLSLLYASSKKKYNLSLYGNSMKVLGTMLIIGALFLDWGAVTFSAQIVWYLPLILSAILVKKYSFYTIERGQSAKN